jgi:exosortase
MTQTEARRPTVASPSAGGPSADLPALLRQPWALGLLLVGPLLLWAYWDSLGVLADKWANDSQYEHGYLVVPFALVLLWLRRERLANVALRPSWWGVPLLAVGALLHAGGAYTYFDWLAMASLVPTLGGLCLLLGGWGAFRWAWPAIAFLGFMFPLPYRLEVMLAYPLQRLATLGSTYALQTLGFTAVAEGCVIKMEDMDLNVIQACSGLSMLLTFFALATGVVLVTKRRALDNALIVLSALPIALVANMVRITATGVLNVTAGKEVGDLVFHDLAGWLMMPLALGMLWAELWLLSRLLIERPAPAPEAFVFSETVF